MNALMRRRGMMVKASGGGRLYIFKDGAYGDWLNGETFVGVNDRYIATGIVDAKNISSVIDGGFLKLSASSSNNRTSYVNFGVSIPRHSVPYKKLGYTVESKSVSRWPILYAGMSETLIAVSANGEKFSGLGEKSMVRVNLEGAEEVSIDLTSTNQNYAVLSINVYGTSIQYVQLSEIWLET